MKECCFVYKGILIFYDYLVAKNTDVEMSTPLS